MSNYWQRYLTERRVTRRAALAATGAASTVVALSLVGCGGGGDDDSGSSAKQKDTSGLLTTPSNSTAQAKQGGTWQHWGAEQPIMNPHLAASNSGLGGFVYSKPLSYKTAAYPNTPAGEVEGDAFESFEIAKDGLQVTFKLRQNLLFDPRPPTNGRAATVDDVKKSWDQFLASSASRGELLNSVTPSSPILNMQTPDARTVVFNLAFPMAAVESRFAYHRYLYILPVEMDGGFDSRTDARGSGPWMLSKATPSVSYEFKRNPGYHKQGRPFFEGLTTTFISDYAQRLAQLKTGGLLTADVRQEDVIAVKRDQTKLNMFAQGFPPDRPNLIGFSQKPGSPFLDERVRRAASMLLERDLWIDTFYNVTAFRKEGLPIETRWHSHFGAGEPPFWHDPQGKGLGEAAQYFQHNPAEAKKLLQAAGTGRIVTNMSYQTPNWDRQAQVFQGMLQDGDMMSFTLKPMDRNDYTNALHTSKGLGYDGLAVGLAPGAGGDIDQYLSTRFNVGSSNFVMFDKPIPNGISELVTKQRAEIDSKKRADILYDLEKSLALYMTALPFPGLANGFDLAQPQLGNFEAYISKNGLESQSAATELWTQYWLDSSKQS